MAIDRSPKEVDINWICDNAFQLGVEEKQYNNENIEKTINDTSYKEKYDKVLELARIKYSFAKMEKLSTGIGYGVRYWNVTEKCWDDEECDDYECSKDAIEEWACLFTIYTYVPLLQKRDLLCI